MGWVLVVLTTTVGLIGATAPTLDDCRGIYRKFPPRIVEEAYCVNGVGDKVVLYPRESE